MKTHLVLPIQHENGRGGEMRVVKTYEETIPCFPGMRVSDVALHRDEELLTVEQVTLLAHDPGLVVLLSTYFAVGDETVEDVNAMFLGQGWTSGIEV